MNCGYIQEHVWILKKIILSEGNQQKRIDCDYVYVKFEQTEINL